MSDIVHVRLGGQEWDWDADLTLNEAFIIKAETGLPVADFLEGLSKLDPDCLQTLLWLCRRQAGEKVARKTIEFRISDLEIEKDEPDRPFTQDAPGTTSQNGTGASTTSPDGTAFPVPVSTS